jgi:low affinity Fe/Cu permease
LLKFLTSHYPKLSDGAVAVVGHRIAVGVVSVFVLGWVAVGYDQGFPTWWFLLANMIGTLVVAFVLILVQHSQNRDMDALQMKVDELIRSSEAGDHWIAAEQRSEEEFKELLDARGAS